MENENALKEMRDCQRRFLERTKRDDGKYVIKDGRVSKHDAYLDQLSLLIGDIFDILDETCPPWKDDPRKR